MRNIYEECPTYKKNLITLRKTNLEDVHELLKCYSDEKALPLFNCDHCRGMDFHYTTVEKMKEAVEFWDFSYKNKSFVRWTVILNETGNKVGTVEMFHRAEDDDFNLHGILRIDLHSNYERKPIIDEILDIVNQNFYKAFEVDAIFTKAVPEASERISSLIHKGYKPITEKFIIYKNYFMRVKKSH